MVPKYSYVLLLNPVALERGRIIAQREIVSNVPVGRRLKHIR
jgi:hypothetical protein